MISDNSPARPHIERVVLSGEIDITTQEALVQALETIRACDLAVIDLRAVTYIDSSGLSALIAFKRRLRATCAADVKLVLADPRMVRLIKVCGFDKLFTVEIEEAAS